MHGCNPREKTKRRFGIVCLVDLVDLVRIVCLVDLVGLVRIICLVGIVCIVLFCQYFFVIFVSKSILLSRHNLWSKKFQKLTATSSFFIHKVFRYCTAGMIRLLCKILFCYDSGCFGVLCIYSVSSAYNQVSSGIISVSTAHHTRAVRMFYC